ncbi:aldo/keto reductase [Dongia deserti]|uniref:aldo/keto reductase n=1 Tax=Dongia deserti TaxID=2268030 RepID=UPI000E65CBF7|nr:aldo/keto reductase [Dongia deserti]
MQHRPLGRSGLSVSALGLGCMGMSEFYGTPNDTESMATLEAAVASGIDFFDTADTYGHGHNEELVGRFLNGKRDKVILATKFGIVRKPGAYERRVDNSPDYIRSACNASLKRLGTDHIELYYMHRRNPDVSVEESVGAMAELVKQGKVKALGLSEVSVETLRKAHNVHPIAAVQSEYSLWSRDAEQGLLQACAELGVTFVAYSPLGRAFLTGTVGTTEDLPDTDFRRANPRFQAEALQRNNILVAALGEFAAEHRAKPAQIALAWLLNKHPHVVPIPGTKRRTYLGENVAAAEIKLNPTDIAELDRIFAPSEVAGARYTEEGMRGVGL